MSFQYSRWDGTQEIGAMDAEAVLDELSEDFLASGDLRSALRRLLRRGPRLPDGRQMPGLQSLLDKLRHRRQEELDRYKLSSVVDDIEKRLGGIVAKERAGIEQRLAEGRARSDRQEDQLDPSLQRTLERIADKKRRFLDQLPKDLGGAVRALSEYDFMDDGARQDFQDLLRELEGQVLEHYFQGIKESLERIKPEDLQRIREMVRDLNKLLRDRLEGREPDFGAFMEKFGDMFPPGIATLDELMEHLQRQMAKMQSLLDSMSPSQRESLSSLMDALLRDDRLKWDLAQLAANLDQLMPSSRQHGRFPFKGDESLTLAEALRVMERLQDLSALEEGLRGAEWGKGDLDQLDANKLRDLLGDEAAEDLDRMKEVLKALEEAGYVRREENGLELTPRGIRRIGQKALQDIFVQLRKDRHGKHQSDHRGTGGDRTDEGKCYQFGDPFLLDLQGTVMNAVHREGAGTPVLLRADDFIVYRTELLTRCATALLVDMSRSMVLRDCFLAAKRVALALDSLIRGQFPGDNLYIIGFSAFAREIKPADLPGITLLDHDMGTNLQHALLLARQLLDRHKGGTRQIIVITDGEPTAHLTPSGHLFFDYPPDPETVRETLKEVARCSRAQIVINTFMLERSPDLIAFVNEMTRINKGRAFFSTADRLGEYVLVDYLTGKTKRVW